MRKNSLIPDIDLQNSREYIGAYNSKDFYKGTSFRMAGEWTTGVHYFNDEYVVDFISFEGTLLSCTQSHVASSLNAPELIKENDKIIGIKANNFWSFVMSGVEGREGKIWIPKVSEDGNLSWVKSDDTVESIDTVNIKGPKGDAPTVNIEKINGVYYWTIDGKRVIDPETGVYIQAQGLKGEIGDTGKVYVPSIVNKNMVFTLTSKVEDESFTVDLSTFKGEKGDTPVFTITEDGILYYYYENNPSSLNELGNVVGPSQEFKIEDDSETGMAGLYCRLPSSDQWTKLGDVGGIPGKSPKIIRVLGDLNTDADDRILWGYDGVPVSEWTTLCYLDELKGDENIWISTSKDIDSGVGNKPMKTIIDPKNSDSVITVEDIDKIWYDPYDVSIDSFSSPEFVYDAYTQCGGQLTYEEFKSAFSNVSGLTIKFWQGALTEFLKEDASTHVNELWLVKSSTGTQDNTFEEYYVVQSPEAGVYMWEKWGSGSVSVDLSNYITKNEAETYITEEVAEAMDGYVIDGGEIELED